MTRIRTAIVGCGKVGHIHASALASLPESKFVAVCDRNEDRARAFAGTYGAQACSGLGKMLDQCAVEALMVCTPHPLHAEAVLCAAQHGVHTLVEKPMAASLSDCDQMIEAAERASIKLGVISQRRFYEPVVRMKKAIDAGKIGKPVLGSVIMLSWRDQAYYESDPWRGKWDTEGGGVLVNQSPHLLDILQWLMGPIEEISGYWANLNHPFIEVEDTSVAMLRFSSITRSKPTAFQAVSFKQFWMRMGGWKNIGEERIRSTTSNITSYGSRSTATRCYLNYALRRGPEEG